jgi:hypothetical protein
MASWPLPLHEPRRFQPKPRVCQVPTDSDDAARPQNGFRLLPVVSLAVPGELTYLDVYAVSKTDPDVSRFRRLDVNSGELREPGNQSAVTAGPQQASQRT